MSKWVVDIHGDIEGDYEIIGEYEEPKSQWISVSKGLPDNNDDVLVWFKYIEDDWDCAWYGLAYYSLQREKWVVSTNKPNPIVVAWAPIPKPYREESEE